MGKFFKFCISNGLFSRSHISPKLPKVKPMPQKKANSNNSLQLEGIEFNATLIR